MNKKQSLGISIIFTILTLGCSSSQNQVQGWSIHMRGMAESIEKLLPYIYDRNRYQDKNNAKFINLYLSNINAHASGLDRHTAKGLSGDDPLFNVGLKNLKMRIQKAYESYYVENYEYSQKLLQTSIQTCNSCHTRTNIGPTFIKWDNFESITKNLDPLDHANILVATRQFPQAVDLLQAKLSKGDIDKEQTPEALSRAMIISLRNLNSPKRALEILNGTAPQSISPQLSKKIKVWKNYLKNWDSRTSKINLKTLVSTKVSKDDHLISSIHNSLILHQGLSTAVSTLTRAQIYYKLGLIYENQLGQFEDQLPENYFEACIYQHPGSRHALKCYYSLESRLFSQSKGRSEILANYENDKLRKLKSMASIKKSSSGSSSGGMGYDDF